ncbi:sensor histidine kinase [Fibrisoma limi]|uniref:sensor histidine kinase n=1 Tax=Fibrisoma limi TaxID=663275 RepID=UPI00031CCAAD|nr:ATP-binding protein [Fibrisoma limi]
MKRSVLYLFLWLGVSTSTLAQRDWPPVYTIKTDTATFSLDTAYFQVLEDLGGTLTFEQAQRSTGFQYAKLYDKYRVAHVYWQRMRLKNDRPHSVRLYLSGVADYFDIYWRDSLNRWQHQRTGYLVSDSQLPVYEGLQEQSRLPLSLASGQETIIYKRTETALWNEPITYLSAYFQTEKGYKDNIVSYFRGQDGWKDFWFAGIAIGILLLAAIYNLTIFYSTKEKVYLYFAICLLFFVLDRNSSYIQATFFGEYPYVFRFVSTFFFITFFVFFVQSIRQFVQPDAQLASLSKAITVTLAITVLMNIFQIISYRYALVPQIEMYLVLEVIIRVVYFLCLILTYRMMKRDVADARYVFIAILQLFFWWSYTLVGTFARIYYQININRYLPPIFEYAETICFAWMIIFFSGALINRYNMTRRQVVQQAIEKEQLEKEREIERSRMIASQNERLEQQVRERTAELQQSLETLRATQDQLVQKEKLASLGELTAGIAHEIQNPLNFVNNFAEVSEELLDELAEERHKAQRDEALEEEILSDLHQNLGKIRHHGRRADAIVKGMLEHSRASTGEKQITDMNALADEYLRLAYHGLRAKDKTFNCQLITHFDPTLSTVTVVTQDIGRVLLNLYNNAFYAVQEKACRDGEQQQAPYQPTVTVQTQNYGDNVVICVRDNGTGIPEAVKRKIFQPFFTTKPTGQGTGLGLSLSYDIITKGHHGELTVESQEGKGTEFTIRLPTQTPPSARA